MVKSWQVLFWLLCFHKVSNSSPKNETSIGRKIRQPDTATSCSKGWYSFGDLCYKLGGKKKIGKLSWEKASERCREEHKGNLVTIHSKELEDFLVAFLLMSAKENLWIGLHDRVNESVYSWDDRSPVDYLNWEPEEPSGVNLEKEDCTEMVFQSGKNGGKSGQWNDNECGVEFQFICQKEKGKFSRANSDPRFCSAEVGGGWSLDSSCYNFIEEEKTWSDAEEYCRSNFRGRLVTITDFAVNLFLNYILGEQEKHVWIGIRTKDEHQQQWASGWYVSYENWAEGEKTDEFDQGSCVARDHDGKWVTHSCNKRLPFLCEYSSEKPPVLRPKAGGGFCPDNPADWRDLGGDLCYYFETKRHVSWYEANFLCTRRGGTLLSIHSEEELKMLHNFIRFRGFAVHIGLYRHIQHDDEFVWADGSPLDFKHWDANEPNSEKEQCAEMKITNLKWNDIECHTARGYICSVPKDFSNRTHGQNANQTIEHSPPCLSGGHSSTVLAGVIVCVLFVAVLFGVVLFYFRLCEKKYERVKKNSGITLQSPSALDQRPRYRSEIVLSEDNTYENMI